VPAANYQVLPMVVTPLTPPLDTQPFWPPLYLANLAFILFVSLHCNLICLSLRWSTLPHPPTNRPTAAHVLGFFRLIVVAATQFAP